MGATPLHWVCPTSRRVRATCSVWMPLHVTTLSRHRASQMATHATRRTLQIKMCLLMCHWGRERRFTPTSPTLTCIFLRNKCGWFTHRPMLLSSVPPPASCLSTGAAFLPARPRADHQQGSEGLLRLPGPNASISLASPCSDQWEHRLLCYFWPFCFIISAGETGTGWHTLLPLRKFYKDVLL